MRDLKCIWRLLKEQPLYCAVLNTHAEPEASAYLRGLGCAEMQGLPLSCYMQRPAQEKDGSTTKASSLPPSPQTKNKLLYYYAMDVASLYPVLALHVGPGDTVLDMCAAPGGKAFALLQMVQARRGVGALALNDVSLGRVKRLQDVLHRCLGHEHKHTTRITTRRGEDWAKIERDTYDKVLVDAPCSSDRHNIDTWLAKGNDFYPDSLKLSKLQHDLLLAALHAVKNGGTVVYSTCTTNSTENDSVVSRVIESATKLSMEVAVQVPPVQVSPWGGGIADAVLQNTELGRLIIPTLDMNIGPMYTCRITKHSH